MFLLLYSAFATVVAGSSLSSGLFVPMLVMGSALGRLVGLMLYDVAVGMGYSEASLASGGLSTAWVDPGVFALLGAGAFMGGVTRLTVSLAVIVMEMSGEIHFLLPILLGITVAKWTADALAPPLYHALLHVKHAPFLPDDPHGAPGLHLHDVSAIMKKLPLTTLRERESVSAIRHAMKHTTHQGFPVVRRADGAPYDVLAGSVSREHLRALLREITSAAGHEDDRQDAGSGQRTGALKRRVAYEELDRMVLTPAERHARGFETSGSTAGASRSSVEMSSLGGPGGSRPGGALVRETLSDAEAVHEPERGARAGHVQRGARVRHVPDTRPAAPVRGGRLQPRGGDGDAQRTAGRLAGGAAGPQGAQRRGVQRAPARRVRADQRHARALTGEMIP